MRRGWHWFRKEFQRLGWSSVNSEFPTPEDLLLKEDKDEGLGTMLGVFFPTINSFIGIVAMTRWGWAVGNVGLLATAFILVLGAAIGGITISSVSAICSNEKVGASGPYFAVSRAMGPQMGGASGALFFLAQALGASLHLLGLAEILKQTIYPQEEVALEGWDVKIVLYAFLLSVIVLLLSLLGARFFARLSTLIMVVVLAAIFQALISFFRPTSDELTALLRFNPGVDTLKNNLYMASGGASELLSVFGVMMPSMVGVLAGANMSANLKEPGVAIPRGSLWSLGCVILLYLLMAAGQAVSIEREELLQDYLVLQKVSFLPEFFFAASLLAAFSSAYTGVVGAAKVFAAMSEDELFPFTKFFAHLGADREPRRAMLLTFVVTTLGILFGNVNTIAPVLSIFFLLTFCAINLACALLHISRTPYFRPSFRFFSWKLSIAGVVLCLYVSVITNGLAAAAALALATACFSYLCLRKFPKHHDFLPITQSLLFKLALSYVLHLDSRKYHAKNWRPQILAVASDLSEPSKIVLFSNDLKKKGLYIVGRVVAGNIDPLKTALLGQLRKEALAMLDREKIQAQIEVVVAPSFSVGVQSLLQISGLGGMKPNTFVTDLPVRFVAEKTVSAAAAAKSEAAPVPSSAASQRMTDNDWPEHANWETVEASTEDWLRAITVTRMLGQNVVITAGLENLATGSVRSAACSVDVWIDARLLNLDSSAFAHLPSAATHSERDNSTTTTFTIDDNEVEDVSSSPPVATATTSASAALSIPSAAVQLEAIPPPALDRICKLLEYAHCFRSSGGWKQTKMRVFLVSQHAPSSLVAQNELKVFSLLLRTQRISAALVTASFSHLGTGVDEEMGGGGGGGVGVIDGEEDEKSWNRLLKMHSKGAGVVFIEPPIFPESIPSGEENAEKFRASLSSLSSELPPTAMIFSGPLQLRTGTGGRSVGVTATPMSTTTAAIRSAGVTSPPTPQSARLRKA